MRIRQKIEDNLECSYQEFILYSKFLYEIYHFKCQICETSLSIFIKLFDQMLFWVILVPGDECFTT